MSKDKRTQQERLHAEHDRRIGRQQQPITSSSDRPKMPSLREVFFGRKK